MESISIDGSEKTGAKETQPKEDAEQKMSGPKSMDARIERELNVAQNNNTEVA